MNQNLQLLYLSTLTKYRKFKSRFDKNLKSGHFKDLSNKKRQLVISRLERLKKRLQNLKLQIKLAIATGALVISLAATEVDAQQLGPFVENKAGNPFRPSPSHAKSHHPAVVDIDGDGDLDVFIGDTDGQIVFLRNDGNPESPYFKKITIGSNPLNSVSIYRVTPTFADLDKDGDFDAIFGQQYVYQFSPSPNLIFLENTGDANNPVFSSPSGEHPVDNIYSDAYYAHPAFVDIDNDGDLDAFVGSNRLDFAVYSENREAIKFWLNDGSLPVAQFSPLVGAANPIAIANAEFGGTVDRAAPALVDIDNDGDYDMFVGDLNGTVRFFINSGTPEVPNFATEATGASNPFNGITFLSNSSPEFADLDNDGDFDAIIGGDLDILRFFENTGDASNPIFTERFDNGNPFGGLKRLGSGPFSYSPIAPIAVDVDGDGFQDVVLGSEFDNDILYFRNNQDGSFSRKTGVDNMFEGLLSGTDSRPNPAVADIDNDGDLDLFVALYSYSGPGYGHVKFFRNDGSNNLILESTPITKNVNYSRYTLSIADFDFDGDFDAIMASDGVNYTIANFLLFENTGTISSPTFVEQPESGPPFNGAEVRNGFSMDPRPTMVDLDHDGDMDVVSGTFSTSIYGGEVRLFQNDGTNNLVNTTDANNPFNTLSSSRDSHPAFLDVDNDGDLDFLIGNKYGEIAFFENTNLAPQVNTNTTSTSYTEGNSPVVLDGTLTLSDDGIDDIIGASIVITNLVSGEDVLGFTPQFGITGSFDNVTGILSLSGYAKLTEYELVLQSVTYQNTSVNPNTTTRTIELSITDFDNTDPFSDSFPEPIINVNVVSVNSTPTVSASIATDGIYTENDTPGVIIDAAITVSDADNANLVGAAISLTTNFTQGEDELEFSNQNGITGSYNATTGVLTLSGNTTLSNYQNALRSIRYSNSSDNPTTLNRTVEFTITDGIDTSTPTTRIVQVVAVNDAPVLSSSSTGSLNYNQNASAILVDDLLSISDVDNVNLQSITVTINGYQSGDVLNATPPAGIASNFDTGTGILSLTGSATIADYIATIITTSFSSTGTGTRQIEFVANDGTDNSNLYSRQIDIIVPNIAPVLSSNNAGNGINYIQNKVAVVVDNQLVINDSDDTNLENMAVSITGYLNGDLLTITAPPATSSNFDTGTGILSVTGSATLAEYQTAIRSVAFSSSNGAGSRTIAFIGNDGDDDSNTYNRQITISNQSPPVVNTTPGTTQVGSTIVIDLCNIISDPDNSFDELTITVVSILSQASTNINTCDLTIDYSGVNFEGEDSLVLRATDPDGNSAENTLTITVEPIDVGEPPVLPLEIFNAISPNGDGLNDWWEIVNLITPNKIELYNRWGDLVKTLTNYENVPDNTQLNELPSGTYFYKIVSPNGEFTGYISIKK